MLISENTYDGECTSPGKEKNGSNNVSSTKKGGLTIKSIQEF